jgi:hypothetical protein
MKIAYKSIQKLRKVALNYQKNSNSKENFYLYILHRHFELIHEYPELYGSAKKKNLMYLRINKSYINTIKVYSNTFELSIS